MSYYNDHRYTARDQANNGLTQTNPATMTILVDPKGNFEIGPFELAAKYEICPTCRGKGTHVNPSIDDNGLSTEDFDGDPDFLDDYMRGVYDVPCYECGGQRVVLEPDESRCDPVKLKAYHDRAHEIAQCDADCRRAMAMGY